MGRKIEIITGRERQRHWSMADKQRIVAETAEPGARVCDVAMRHVVAESLVFTWRRQVRECLLTKSDAPVLLPLQVIGDQSASVASRPDRAASPSLAHRASEPCRGEAEITLANGTTIRAVQNISLASLHQIVTALHG